MELSRRKKNKNKIIKIIKWSNLERNLVQKFKGWPGKRVPLRGRVPINCILYCIQVWMNSTILKYEMLSCSLSSQILFFLNCHKQYGWSKIDLIFYGSFSHQKVFLSSSITSNQPNTIFISYQFSCSIPLPNMLHQSPFHHAKNIVKFYQKTNSQSSLKNVK